MNRPVTAVFAALESLLVVGIGVGIPVVSLTFLWAFQYGLQVDWSVFWRAGVDIWLVGHGVDLTLTLLPAAATATGIPGAGAPILISMAALGFAVLTVLLGARAGRRLAETQHRALGSLVAIGAFAVVSAGVVLSARANNAEPSVVQGIVWPTVVYGVPLLIAAEVSRRRRGADADPLTARVLDAVEIVPDLARSIALVALRAGSAVAAAVFGVAGVIVALLLMSHYASVIALYEGAHAGVLGGIALTLGQVALIPNAIAWAASWLVGPGFSLGTGSSISPLGTNIGPMPAIPFLGALPTSELTFGFVGILVPVVAAFALTTLFRPRIEAALGRDDSPLTRVVVGAAIGVVAGLAVGLTVALASGSAGPGRLATVGADGATVGAFAALEVAVPSVLALVVSRREQGAPSRFARSRDDRTTDRHDLDDGDPDQRETDVLPRFDGRGRAGDPAALASPDDVVTERLDGFRR